MEGSTEESKDDNQLPIDKGWAWVIVGAAFCLFGLQTGGFKSQGILLVELIERYEGVYSASLLIWVFTIKYTLGSLLAPLVGFLIVKFSHRMVAAAGIIIHVIAYIGLSQSTSFPVMIAAYSIISAIGEQSMYMTPLLVSKQYFKKRKALALGIIASGGGVGAMALPYVYRFLFDTFPFNEACILYGGFCLQFLIPVCLFRPISFYSCRRSDSAQKEVKQQDNAEVPLLQERETIPVKQKSDEHGVRQRSASFSHRAEDTTASTTIFYSTSHLSPPISADTSHDITGSAAIIGEQQGESASVEQSEGIAKETFNWRVVLMPKYILKQCSLCFYLFGAFSVWQVIPPLGKEAGLSKDTVAICITIAGALEIPCRIMNGYFADKNYVTIMTQYAFSVFVPGIMCLICGFISGLPGVLLVLIGMSTVGTSVFSITPVMIDELLGARNVTSALSCQLFFASIAFSCTTYITGTIYDTSGSWRIVCFYLAATMMMGSCVVLPYCMIRWCRENCTKSINENSNVKDGGATSNNNIGCADKA